MGFSSSRRMRPRMKRAAIAGTSVTERRAAKAIEKVLVNASGLKSRPSVPSSVNTGRNATVMTRSEKKIGRPTSTRAAVTTSWRGAGRPAVSQSSSRLCTFSTTMMAASTMAPMAMAIPPEAHDVGAEVQGRHWHEGQQHGDGQHQDRHQRRAHVQEEDEDDDGHHHDLLQQRVPEGRDAVPDQRRPIVGRHHLDAGRQRGGELGQPLFHRGDDVEGVAAVAHDHHRADRLPFAVQIHQAAPLGRPDLDPGHVAQGDRRAVLTAEDHLLQIGGALDVAATADEVLGAGDLQHPSADVVVRAADGVGHLHERDPEALQATGVEVDLVFAGEAPHAGHLGDAGDALQRVAERPVLQRLQLGEAVPAAPVDDARTRRPSPRRWRRGRAPASPDRAAGRPGWTCTRGRGCAPSRCRSPPRR